MMDAACETGCWCARGMDMEASSASLLRSPSSSPEDASLEASFGEAGVNGISGMGGWGTTVGLRGVGLEADWLGSAIMGIWLAS